MHRYVRSVISPGVIWSAVLLILTAGTLAEDWPHWRGLRRNDLSRETSGWSAGRWRIGKPAWTAQVGLGSTSPVVADGKLYVLGWDAGRDHLTCRDVKTGDRLWSISYACPKYGRHAVGDQGMYAGPTSTPEYDSETGYLYTLSTDGNLNCWDVHNRGRNVWSLNLYDKYQVRRRPKVGRRSRRDYGYTTSPRVYEDSLIVEVGSDAGNLVAFDKRTGKQQWTSQNKDPAGHTGGLVLIEVARRPCVAVLTLKNLVVTRVDSKDHGETVATYPWITDFGNNVVTPVVVGQDILITSAYNHMSMCRLHISSRSAKKVWETRVASGVCTPVIIRDAVYWAWRGVHCLDLATGNERWSGGTVGAPGSCIVTADERLVIWANRGELSLIETGDRSHGQYTELFKRSDLGRSEAWPHIVLAGGRLFCKDRNGNLACLRIQ